MGKSRSARKTQFQAPRASAQAGPSPLAAAATTIANNPRTTDQSGASAELVIDPAAEYVAGYGLGYSALERFLPAQRTDPHAPEVTFETYRLMLNDPEVGSDVGTLVGMVLAEGLQITPAFEGRSIDEDAPEFGRAVEVAEFAQRNFAGLRKALDDVLEGMIEGALTYGHKTAEITWKIGAGVDRDRLVLDRIAQKDSRTLDFVVDRFWNHLGFRARNSQSQQIIPRSKFLHLVLREEDEDPRGRSSIRSSYTGWTFKQLVWPEYKRWLDNCALPTTVGKTAPKQPGDVQRNADGTKKDGGRILSPSEAMGQALAGLKNAGYIVVPNGADVTQLEVVDDGTGFERAIAVADGQIAKGILHQTLATGEAQFGTRAQSETHMGVLDLLVSTLKGRVIKAIQQDLVAQMIQLNFGDDWQVYAPQISLGDTERRDWSVDATAAAAIEGAITDSQWAAITTQLGLPAPLPGEKPRREARTEAQTSAQALPQPQPNTPPTGRTANRRSGSFVSMRIRPTRRTT